MSNSSKKKKGIKRNDSYKITCGSKIQSCSRVCIAWRHPPVKRHIIYSTAGSHSSPAWTDKKYIHAWRQDILLASSMLCAVYHVESQLDISGKLHEAWRCASTWGRSVLGSGSDCDTHTHTNTCTQTLIHSELGPDFLTRSRVIGEQTLNSFTSTRTHKHRCELQVCIRMTEGGGGVIFTSASVILSIKAKRTAACHNSLRQGVTQLLRVHLPLTQQRGWKVTAVTKKQWGRKKQRHRKDRLRECVILIYRLISNLKLFYQVGK